MRQGLRQDLCLIHNPHTCPNLLHPARFDPQLIQDPTVYRLYEAIMHNGEALKAIVNGEGQNNGKMQGTDRVVVLCYVMFCSSFYLRYGLTSRLSSPLCRGRR